MNGWQVFKCQTMLSGRGCARQCALLRIYRHKRITRICRYFTVTHADVRFHQNTGVVLRCFDDDPLEIIVIRILEWWGDTDLVSDPERFTGVAGYRLFHVLRDVQTLALCTADEEQGCVPFVASNPPRWQPFRHTSCRSPVLRGSNVASLANNLIEQRVTELALRHLALDLHVGEQVLRQASEHVSQ